MFIEALSSRDSASSAEELQAACQEAGAQGVKNINQLLGK